MNATIADLIESLKGLGYRFHLDGEKVKFQYAGVGDPPEEVKALLETLRTYRTEAVAYLKGGMPRPYLDGSGDLVIPFGSDPKYHWWAGGQSIAETMAEITSKERL